MISVVLPTYNGEEYLRYSIESVIVQTYRDWELIIVDDGSNDESGSIADYYAQIDNRIRIIRNDTNRGLPDSLNIGFNNAHGEFYTWTSDDNIYLPQALERMITTLKTMGEDVAMVTARCVGIDNEGKMLGYMNPFLEERIYLENRVCACFLYRSRAAEIVGKYSTQMKYVEDYDYWLRIYEKAGEIRWIPEILYLYRFHNGSLTASKKKDINIALTKLWIKYKNSWLTRYSNSPEKLCVPYFSMIPDTGDEKIDAMVSDVKNSIMERIPILRNEIKHVSEDARFLIFGSGKYGEMALERLGERAIAFVDNNRELFDTYKGGIQIKSLDDILDGELKDVPILVALGPESMYSVINQLHSRNVLNYYTYQTVFPNQW